MAGLGEFHFHLPASLQSSAALARGTVQEDIGSRSVCHLLSGETGDTEDASLNTLVC